jgi:hypothetical protein
LNTINFGDSVKAYPYREASGDPHVCTRNFKIKIGFPGWWTESGIFRFLLFKSLRLHVNFILTEKKQHKNLYLDTSIFGEPMWLSGRVRRKSTKKPKNLKIPGSPLGVKLHP